MVRSGDGNRIDALVLKQLAEIGISGGTLLPQLFDFVQPRVQDGLVDITHRGDLNIGHLGIAADVLVALRPYTDARYANCIIGTGQNRPARDSGRGGAKQEVSTLHKSPSYQISFNAN